MQSYSVKQSEATRLFNLIQQEVKQPRYILTAEILTEFLYSIYPEKKSDVVKVMHEIDKMGREMNQDNFGFSLAMVLQAQTLHSETQIHNYYAQIENVLFMEYHPTITIMERWDDAHQKTEAEIVAHYETIKSFEREIVPYINKIDLNVLDSLQLKINFCLSIVNLHQNIVSDVIEQYKLFINTTFLNVLEYSITVKYNQPPLLIETLKTLCYLYTAMKYKPINELLHKSFLHKREIWGLLMNLFSNAQPEIRYYTAVLSALISKHLPEFNREVLTNSELLVTVCRNIAQLTDNEGLYFAIMCLNHLIQSFSQQQLEWQTQNLSTVSNINSFALETLSKGEVQTQGACLTLIAQCIGIYELSSAQISSIKIVSKVFESNQQILQIATLKIVQKTLKWPNQEIKGSIIGQNSFITFLKRNLSVEHTDEDLHYSCLETAYLLCEGNSINYFFEKDLVSCLIRLSQNSKSPTLTMISKIVLKLIQKSLEKEWMLVYLHQKDILSCIGALFKNSTSYDQNMCKFCKKDQDNFIYFNKQIFTNCLKAIYLLCITIGDFSDDLDMKRKRVFVQHLSYSLVMDLHRGIELFFQRCNRKLIFTTLKEEISIPNKKNEPTNMKLYKLINFVLEELTMDADSKSIDILRSICQLRKTYYHWLYEYFKLYELEIEGIPIYFTMFFKLGDRTLQRIIPYKYDFASFKNYLSDFAAAHINCKLVDFQIWDIDHKSPVNTESEFREMVETIFHTFEHSHYAVNIQISNVTERVERIKDHFTSYNYRPQEPSYERPEPYFPPNRFSTTIIPNKTYSPHHASGRKMNTSYQLPNQRVVSKSPAPNAYGHRCPKCGGRTNNAQLCDSCSNYM